MAFESNVSCQYNTTKSIQREYGCVELLSFPVLSKITSNINYRCYIYNLSCMQYLQMSRVSWTNIRSLVYGMIVS